AIEGLITEKKAKDKEISGREELLLRLGRDVQELRESLASEREKVVSARKERDDMCEKLAGREKEWIRQESEQSQQSQLDALKQQLTKIKRKKREAIERCTSRMEQLAQEFRQKELELGKRLQAIRPALAAQPNKETFALRNKLERATAE